MPKRSGVLGDLASGDETNGKTMRGEGPYPRVGGGYRDPTEAVDGDLPWRSSGDVDLHLLSAKTNEFWFYGGGATPRNSGRGRPDLKGLRRGGRRGSLGCPWLQRR